MLPSFLLNDQEIHLKDNQIGTRCEQWQNGLQIKKGITKKKNNNSELNETI